MRFFTSDLHFGHGNIMKFEPEARPFDSMDEMNEAIIDAHNSMVNPGDIVYVLGDVAMGAIADSLPLAGRLNGFKYLIPGNHDRVFSGTKPGMAERFAPEYLKVFTEILEEKEYLCLGNAFDALLCHFPYSGDHTDEDRYQDQRPTDIGLPLIHGHVHGLWRTNGRQFNVGIDANSLMPTPEDEIIAWIETL